ncbi:calponin homology domain-containing protein DDB_G0272472-like isoform X19 [Scylla paramamosain]|uniref:calponin homology domain-containing protein DDB_G0272472-like isoform X19 n=1 Tax=Scylla paramamosain TaxID=85552 RepID=UPI003083719C
MGVKKTPPIHAENQQLLTPGLSIENVKIKEKTWGPRRTPGMSSPKHDRDSDRESLTGWTLVDREGKEGKPEKTTRSRGKKEDDKDSGESSSSPVDVEKKDEENKEKNESGCGTEEEGEEELSEDLISMGKRVQEIKGESVKASSGSDSSDIETLDCPGPDDFYEDHTQGYSSLHSSLLSSSLSGFTFVEDADDGDVESLGSSDVLVLDQEGKGVDEETDLSLASSPSLPEDLPAIKPDTQYRHTPDRDLNSRLNIVVALTLACVLGLGLGHFLGWSSRSMWQENLNSAQIIEALNLENEELRSEISRLQQENVSPIKISGKDGKIARDMRERITQLLIDNEELRVAAAKQQFDSLPEGDTRAFNNALGTNYKLRLAVSKLIHLVPDLTSLKVSANDLQKENEELQNQVGKLRYQEQPLPQELNAVTREVEGLKKVIDEASKKKKAPPNFENAKIYLSYMSQVLQSLQDFKEGGFVEKLDVATDVFEGLVPGNMKPSASVHQKLNSVRTKFNQLRSSLASKWDKIKDLGRPQNLVRVSQDTLAKMNRVIVNVVNKMKDIGQVSIMKRGKASFESTTATLAQSLAALGDQFEKTWNNLEAEVDTDGEEVGDELLAEEGRAGAEEEEEDEGIVDDMEAEERKPQDMGKEPSEIKNLGPNKAKEGGKSGEAGNGEGGRGGSGGRGGGGRGGGGGGGGGDDKKDLDDKKSNKETVEKKEKPDGKRDRSRSRVSSKEEKKEEKKEKKAKKKEEKAKKKKEKEDKKSKKDKNNNKKTKEEKENYNHKKDDWGKKNLQEDDKRHQRKQFNKFDKKQHRHGSDDDDDDDDDDEENDDGKFKKKYQKKKPVYEDDDDNDSDDNSKRKSHKNEVLEEDDDDDDKKKGLLRHWEKPSRKNYRREYPGPKKAFIRRRGKNATRYHGDEDRDWMQKRATGREVRRREEQKADWLFERAKHRSHRRVEEQKADWLFDRASHRRDQRVGEAEEHSHRAVGDNEKLQSHTKHERRQAKRRYVRFDYDDDDYDDDDEIDNDDYQLYHHPHHHHQHHHHHQERGRAEQKHHSKKGKREWVIPNFSATGKTYYY